MERGPRFCINCGRAIGDLPACDNPDCLALPNFYRDVPGPERPGSYLPGGPAAQGQPSRPPEESGKAATGRPESTIIEGPIPERTTVAIHSAIALLRSAAPPILEHLLYPGAVEVGARAPAKIVIDRPEVSSRHARLECRPTPAGRWQVHVSDLGSRNGTFVNGEKLPELTSRHLSTGDKIRFANVEYELRIIETEKPRVTMQI